MIYLDNVTKMYEGGEIPALEGVNVSINKGEFVFLVGKSGAGKSTLLKLLLREITPTSGNLQVGGYDLVRIKKEKIPLVRRKVGIVFQDYRLLENRTVFENVAFAMEVMQKPTDVINKTVPRILNVVGLKSKARKYPNQLSGGEQQRVAIARSIINKPEILICDEPTGNLDPTTSAGIMNLLSKINEYGTTLIIATHDKVIVDAMQKRVIALDNGHIVSDKKGGYPH